MDGFGGYPGHKEVRYMFIDGEQLRRTAHEVGNAWFGRPVDIDYPILQGACQKVFYYDCLPAKKSGADDLDFQGRLDEKKAFFNELRRLPGWHVGQGLARHRKKERQEQKEVDILIAVDMLTHTHRRNMQRLTFISGDQDFAPLLEAVVRDGMYVELLYPPGHTAEDLMHFADVAKPMDVDFLHGISTENFKKHNGLPARSDEYNDTPPGADLVGEALLAGMPYARVWRDRAPSQLITIKTIVPNSINNGFLTVRDPDEERAKRYFVNWMERDFGLVPQFLRWAQRP